MNQIIETGIIRFNATYPLWKLMIKFPGGEWIEWKDNGTNGHQRAAYILYKNLKTEEPANIEVPHVMGGTFCAKFSYCDKQVTYERADGTHVAMKTRYCGSLGFASRMTDRDVTEDERDSA